MKRIAAALLPIGIIAFGASAHAADLKAPVYKAAPVAVAPAYNWTGFYVGLSLGARKVDPDWTTTRYFDPGGGLIPFDSSPNASFDDTAFRIGGHFGYNWLLAPAWVVGLEADIGWADNKATVGRIPGTNTGGASFSQVEASWDGSVRARLGYLVTPAVLIYGTGGVAWQRLEARGVCPADTNVCNPATGTQSGSVATTRTGWTVGGGIEAYVAANWLARAEYRYADFNDFTFTALQFNSNAFGAVANISTVTHIVLFGISYKFGAPAVVARY